MTIVKFNARRAHINYVLAWGYTLSEAFMHCKKNNWFGDIRAI